MKMLWFKKKDQKIIRHDNEPDIRHIIEMKEITLALAEMVVDVEFGLHDESSKKVTNFAGDIFSRRGFIGVVHLHSDAMIWARLNLTKREIKSPYLGKVEFHYWKDVKYLKYPIFERQLFVQVEIHDEHGIIFDSLKEALRDAAISDYRFIHFNLQLEDISADSAVVEMKEKGHFAVGIKSVSYAHQITLSKAPVWSWQWSYWGREC